MRWAVLGALAALISAFVWSAVAPTAADAQDGDDPTSTLVISDAVADRSFRTIALTLDSGTVGLAALSGSLVYDSDAITVLSCEVSEAGACNAGGEGRVRMSVFNLSGLRDNDQLMTVDFVVADGATGETVLSFDFDTAVNFDAVELPDVPVEDISFVVAPAEFGSLTGDVVAADSQTGLFAIDVCAVNNATQAATCTTSTGLGSWRIDDVATGSYTITIADPGEIYANASVAAVVTADEITTGVDATLGYLSDVVEEDTEEDTEEDSNAPGDSTPIPPAPAQLQAVEVIYEASIAGKITALDTAKPIEGLTVCATQPLVLHQSCASTDANGNYAVSDLSAGNYWVTVVDPLGLFEDAPVELVGVVGDTGERQGVNIQLNRIAG